MAAQQTQVSFKLVRKVGQDEITLEARSAVPVGEEAYEYNRLMGYTVDALKDYVNNFMTLTPTSTAAMGPGDWLEVEKVVVTVDNGKRFVKALMPGYSEHGCIIWPEVAKQIDLNLDLVPLEGKVPSKPLLAFVGPDGKGKAKIKALRIEAVQK